MQIHAFSTGSVKVKTAQAIGRGPIRVASVLLSREWTPPLPINVWLIEHPEGLIVVDTGETARSAEPGYFPRWQPYFKLAVRIDVKPEQEIGPQLIAAGFDPNSVKKVVMTHMHTDHAGGMHHFPNSQILITADELALVRSPLAKVNGYLPHRLPDWFDPTVLVFTDGPFGDFATSAKLTEAGDVRAVPTPGHTPGHCSVVIAEPGGGFVFLAGDTSYTETAMLEAAIDGVSPKRSVARKTLEAIRGFAETAPVTYLPTHDPDSARRLAQREPAVRTTNVASR